MAGRIRYCARSRRRSPVAGKITVRPQLDPAVHTRRRVWAPTQPQGATSPASPNPASKQGAASFASVFVLRPAGRAHLLWPTQEAPSFKFRTLDRPKPPQSPGTALLPRRSLPSQTPGHPQCIQCSCGGRPSAKKSVGACHGILRIRTTAAASKPRWPPAQPLQNQAQKTAAPVGNPLILLIRSCGSVWCYKAHRCAFHQQPLAA